jgi:hypothetical protein
MGRRTLGAATVSSLMPFKRRLTSKDSLAGLAAAVDFLQAF